MNNLFDRFLFFVSGITSSNFRKVCSKCGKTGQAHFKDFSCFRFKD